MADDCLRAQGLTEQGDDGELSSIDRAWLVRHLENCPVCRAAQEIDQSLERDLTTLPVLACPEELTRRIVAAVAPRSEARSHWPWRWAALAAAAAAVAALVLWPSAERVTPIAPPTPSAAEALAARHQARATLVFTARLIRTTENDLIREVLGNDLPRRVRKSTRESLRDALSRP